MISRDPLARLLPLSVAAGGLWLTLGVVTPIAASATERLAVVSSARLGFALVAAALALAWTLRIPAVRLHPLYLAVLLWLPWLPVPIPSAFLLWDGPLATAVWAAIAGLLLSPPMRAAWMRVLAATPRRQRALAVVLAAVAYMAAAARMAPVLPGGDEPHYLVITQSLLYDGDLKIENNHRRGDYRAYVSPELKPDYLRRGVDREIYSIHAPGLAVLVLPAFALAGYPGVVICLSLLSALGTALVWRLAWRVTGNVAAAWAGWATVALSVPFFFQAFTVYPDGPAAAVVITGVYALAFPDRLAAGGWRAAAHGAVLATLPWMHTRYAVLAAVLGVLIAIRLWQQAGEAGQAAPWPMQSRRIQRSFAFLAVPFLSMVAWLWFFRAVYGEFNPAAPYGGYTQSSLTSAPRGLAGLLIDQQFGVLPNAPAYLMAFIGVGALWRTHRRLTGELVLLAGSYAIAVASYHMWWGGHSSPARFLVPVLLPFGIAAAAQWARSTPLARCAFAVLLAVSVGLAAVLACVDRGALVYNVRDGFGLWMDRAAPLVNLPRAMPTLFRNTGSVTTAQIAGWVAAGISSWLLLRYSRRVHPEAATPVCFALACTLMIGATLGWRVAGASSLETGTALTRVARAAADRGTVITLPGLRRQAAAPALALVPVPSAPRRDVGAASALFVGRDLPAGRYRVIADGPSALSGTIEATVGRRAEPLLRTILTNVPAGPTSMLLDLPAGARLLTIGGDLSAARAIRQVWLRIEVLTGAGDVPLASSAIRYGAATVWFLDEGAFPEPEGWWVRGGGDATVLIDPAPADAPVPLLIRNGAAKNRATLSASAWTATLDLAPGEERRIDVPGVDGRARLRVTSDAGFRPSDVDRASRDERLLGLWVQIRPETH
jgi:hypothetical protein